MNLHNSYHSIPVVFNIMAKPFGPVCNLSCHYCYYLEKEKMYDRSSRFKMDEAVLEKFISEYIASQNVPVIQFVWHGGEPTMLGLDYFRKVLELQNKHKHNRTIENVLQTNGTLLDDNWCSFFKDNNFLI
ncbi:MAG: radical SAM protein, partial [Bacteroidales bacterium]|nr:radical SAM protein [Bacteroidales bacterium]